MARVNIDDDIESKRQFKRLIKLVNGDEDKAFGMLVRFWRLAQDYWGEGKLVPLEDIADFGFQLMIDSGWAIVKPEGVYAIESETRFAWYRQRCDASKKGGRPPKTEESAPIETESKDPKTENSDPKTGTKPEINSENRNIDSENRNQNSVNPLTLTLKNHSLKLLENRNTNTGISEKISGPSPDLDPGPDPNPNAVADAPAVVQSELNLGENKVSVTKKPKFSENTRRKMQAFIAAYSFAWSEKYKSKPEGIRDKALIGKLGHWIEHVAEVRAIQLVEVYLQISYRPFTESCHDLWQFFRHLNRIGIALDTGKDENQTDWDYVFGRTS